MLHCGLSELGGCDGAATPVKLRYLLSGILKKIYDTILDPIIGSISFLNRVADSLLPLKQQAVPG